MWRSKTKIFLFLYSIFFWQVIINICINEEKKCLKLMLMFLWPCTSDDEAFARLYILDRMLIERISRSFSFLFSVLLWYVNMISNNSLSLSSGFSPWQLFYQLSQSELTYKIQTFPLIFYVYMLSCLSVILVVFFFFFFFLTPSNPCLHFV